MITSLVIPEEATMNDFKYASEKFFGYTKNNITLQFEFMTVRQTDDTLTQNEQEPRYIYSELFTLLSIQMTFVLSPRFPLMFSMCLI